MPKALKKFFIDQIPIFEGPSIGRALPISPRESGLIVSPLILNEARPGRSKTLQAGLFCYNTSYIIDRIWKICFIAQMWCYDITPIP
jgi:hypothetical protein